MGRFFGSFTIDKLSFWLGFLAGAIVLWLLGRARPWLSQQFRSARQGIRSTRESITANSEVRLRNDVLRQAERMHLAAPLFSLSEILIQPRLLAPPLVVEPGAQMPPEDIATGAVPYTPDWPELAALYRSPTLTLAEALQSDANLILIGAPGSGKTVALANLAIRIARQESLPPNLQGVTPIWIQAATLKLPPSESESSLNVLITAIAQYASSLTMPRLPAYLASSIENGNAILLLDGVDELPHEFVNIVVDFLKRLLQEYPRLRIVVAASPLYFDGLTALGLLPVSMAVWSEKQKALFLDRWSKLWAKYVAIPGSSTDSADNVLINSWLLNEKNPCTPLEFTLKVWAAYAGDSLGPSVNSALEAYIRRMTHGIQGARLGLENLAVQSLLTHKPIFKVKDAHAWVADYEPPSKSIQESVPTDAANPDSIEQKPNSSSPAPASRILPGLMENGLIQTYPDETLGFNHTLIMSYLAGVGLRSNPVKGSMPNDPSWIAWIQAIAFMASTQNELISINQLVETNSQPLQLELLSAGRCLPYGVENAEWRIKVMRLLANVLQEKSQPLALRTRALAALAVSGSPGVSVLFRQLTKSDQHAQRQIAALGLGYTRDPKGVDDLQELLSDGSLNVRRAACLALVAIGSKPALECVADALISGDDDLRRSAAEALANHPEEGYPTLKEGAFLDDVLVRKAVVSGLQRVRQSWATQIIEKLHLEDEQWVVKDAAAQALKELAQPKPFIPRPFPPVYNLPWLIAFAGEQGIGVSPGKAAQDLLKLAFKEGNEEQRIAAINYLGIFGDSSDILPLYQVLYSAEIGELKEAAFDALWQLAAAGIELPPPAQFGLGLSN